jgi:hypothetical protein
MTQTAARTRKPSTKAEVQPIIVSSKIAAVLTDKETGNAYDLHKVDGSKGAIHYVYVRNGLACHCSCKDRQFHPGRACKHMTAYNAPAVTDTAAKVEALETVGVLAQAEQIIAQDAEDAKYRTWTAEAYAQVTGAVPVCPCCKRREIRCVQWGRCYWMPVIEML